MLGGKPCRRAFQRFAHDVKLADRALIEFGNHHAALRIIAGQPFAAQSRQRFAHRCAADAEPLRNLDFAQTQTRQQTPKQKSNPEMAIGALAERPAFSLRWRWHAWSGG